MPPVVPAEGLEPPTTGLRTPRLYPLSYAGLDPGRDDEVRETRSQVYRHQPANSSSSQLP